MSGGTSATTQAVSDGIDAGGGELAGILADSYIADAIPVIGEATAVVGGLVAIGDGLYHLFHHHLSAPPPKPPPTLPSGSLQAQPTSKYADALPSLDASVDKAASSTMF